MKAFIFHFVVLPKYCKISLPAMLDMLTILPWDFFNNGRKVLVTSNIPQTLTSAIVFARSSGVHSKGAIKKIPALFTIPHRPGM